jgi:hypothetical protein
VDSIDIDKREQFIRDCFAVFERVLEPELVARLRSSSDGILDQQEDEHFRKMSTSGSNARPAAWC